MVYCQWLIVKDYWSMENEQLLIDNQHSSMLTFCVSKTMQALFEHNSQ